MQASAAPDDPFAAPADPVTTAPAPAAAPPSSTASASADPFGGADPFAGAPATVSAGLSSQDWVIALGVIAAAAVLWFFVRRFVETMLARQHVAPDAAAGASWALFGFLLALTATVVLGVVGELWAVTLFVWPMLGLCLVLLIVMLVLFFGALGRRR